MLVDIPEELCKRILFLSKKNVKFYEEGFCAYDWSGENVDDAWESGVYEGEISMAQELASYLKPVRNDEQREE